MQSIKNRLKKLEQHTAAADIPAEIVGVIDTAYYDELTDSQKECYCEYYHSDRDTVEKLQMYIRGDLHFKLERQKPKPKLTPAEEQAAAEQTTAYIEKWFKQCQERYEREHE